MEDMREHAYGQAAEGLAERVSEMKRDALKTGYPGQRNRSRLNFITRLSPGETIVHTLVEMEDRIWDSWIEMKEPDWEEIGGIQIKEEKLVSKAGKGRSELSEMAQWFPHQEPGGILDKLRHR